MFKNLLLALVVLTACFFARNVSAQCPLQEYRFPYTEQGKVKLALNAFAFGDGIQPAAQCLSGDGKPLVIAPNPAMVGRMVPGQVVGTILLAGDGDYWIPYRGVNDGSVAVTVQIPLVMGSGGQIELQPEHPQFHVTFKASQSVLSKLSPFGANTVALSFRAPVWRTGDQYLVAMELTATDRAPPGLQWNLGPVGGSIEPRWSTFTSQIRPYFTIQISQPTR